MKTAKPGDMVAVHYIGTLDNGRIFDSRDDDDPLTITLGQQEVFPALEAEIIGMKEGQVKNIILPAEAAYGPRRQENILQLDKKAFPTDKELAVGRKLNIEFADGAARTMIITALGEETVTLDGNHVLAGLELTFALKLAEIIREA